MKYILILIFIISIVAFKISQQNVSSLAEEESYSETTDSRTESSKVQSKKKKKLDLRNIKLKQNSREIVEFDQEDENRREDTRENRRESLLRDRADVENIVFREYSNYLDGSSTSSETLSQNVIVTPEDVPPDTQDRENNEADNNNHLEDDDVEHNNENNTDDDINQWDQNDEN
jgi:hypothetical protein